MNKRTIAQFNDLAPDLKSDPFGYTMSAFFDVVGELHNRGAPIPSKWEFRPSLSAMQEVSDDNADLLAAMTNAELLEVGALCHRLSEILSHTGRAY